MAVWATHHQSHHQSIAGIAMFKPKRNIYCLDGDGAAIMHMGAMAAIGQNGPSNLKHILFNNGAHDSVGGQPTENFWLPRPIIFLVIKLNQQI